MKNDLATNVSLSESEIPNAEINSSVTPRLNANLFLGSLGSIISGITIILIWTYVSYFTGYHVSFVILLIGICVGFSMRISGMGEKAIYGLVGSIITITFCFTGTILSLVGYIAYSQDKAIIEVLSWLNTWSVFDLLMTNSNPMIVLYFIIAGYSGFRISINEDRKG